MIAYLAALALTVAQPDPPRCALARLDACRTAGELVWDRAFRRAVRAFLGQGNADYLYHGRLADQQFAVLGGPPETSVRMGDLYRFTACRAHSCDEKGVAVLRPDGTIVALGILHSACVQSAPPEHCSSHLALTVFVNRPPAASVMENLTDWARSRVARAYRPAGPQPARLDRVETLLVRNGRRTVLAPATSR